MQLERCENGHFFDREKYSVCPMCHHESQTEEHQQTGTPSVRERSDITEWNAISQLRDGNRTIRDHTDEEAISSFVTGWLVCVEGPERGRDYRLRGGFNRIGRSHKMDVCIFEDDGISRDQHCSVVYEERKNQFLLVPGSGTVSFHREILSGGPIILSSGDRFQISETVLEFIAFCREDVRWKS